MKKIKILSVILALILITGCVSTRVETDDAVNLSEKENTIETETDNSEEISSKIQGHWFCKSSDGFLIMSIEDNNLMAGYYATDFFRDGIIENIVETNDGFINVTVNFPESNVMDEYIPQSTEILKFSTNDNYHNTLIHHSFDGNSYTYTYAGETYEQLTEKCNKLMF